MGRKVCKEEKMIVVMICAVDKNTGYQIQNSPVDKGKGIRVQQKKQVEETPPENEKSEPQRRVKPECEESLCRESKRWLVENRKGSIEKLC